MPVSSTRDTTEMNCFEVCGGQHGKRSMTPVSLWPAAVSPSKKPASIDVGCGERNSSADGNVPSLTSKVRTLAS